MIEALGLATSAEIPVVVVDVMRGGPSTGIPTKSEQADLNIAIYGMHGDAPHLVLAPQSVGDCVFTTQWATYLAETLQAPGHRSVRPVHGPVARRHRTARRRRLHRRAQHRHRNCRRLQAPRHDGQRRVADGASRERAAANTPPTASPIPNARRRPAAPATICAQLDKRRDKLERLQLRRPLGERRRQRRYSRSSPGVRSPAPRARRSRSPPPTASTCAWWRRGCWRRSSRNGSTAALNGVKRILVVEQTHGAQFNKYLRAHYDLPAPVRVFNRPGTAADHGRRNPSCDRGLEMSHVNVENAPSISRRTTNPT